jgi:hypothetical protein
VESLEARIAELEGAIARHDPFHPLVDDHLQRQPNSTNQTLNGTAESHYHSSPTSEIDGSHGHEMRRTSSSRSATDGIQLQASIEGLSQLSGSNGVVMGHGGNLQGVGLQNGQGGGAPRRILSRSHEEGKAKDDITAGVALLSLNSSAE